MLEVYTLLTYLPELSVLVSNCPYKLTHIYMPFSTLF